MTRTMIPKPVTELRCELGESPVWQASIGRLAWVDLLAGQLHSAAWISGGLKDLRTLQHDAPIGAAAPRRNGGWIVAAGSGFARVSVEGDVTPFADAEPGSAGRLRMNDGKCDPRGRFLAGSMAYDAAAGQGTLFQLSPDGKVKALIEGSSISNGLGWTNDGRTFFWIDTAAGQVNAFDYDLDTGNLSGRRILLQTAQGESPDGMTVDAEDGLWIAFWGSSVVRRFDAAGSVSHTVEFPVTQPTCPVLGGPTGTTLFITTAYHGLTDTDRDKQPLAGSVFACEVDVPGQPTAVFAG